MAKNVSSVDFTQSLPIQHRKWTQSVDEVLNGGVTLGVPIGKNNAGVFNEFSPDTSNGVLIRVGANGTTEQKYIWGAIGTGIAINHGLQRQPIGFKIVDKDKTVDVWRTVTPTINTITLAPSDNTVNVTLYIF
jgi:hypothetical protein